MLSNLASSPSLLHKISILLKRKGLFISAWFQVGITPQRYRLKMEGSLKQKSEEKKEDSLWTISPGLDFQSPSPMRDRDYVYEEEGLDYLSLPLPLPQVNSVLNHLFFSSNFSIGVLFGKSEVGSNSWWFWGLCSCVHWCNLLFLFFFPRYNPLFIYSTNYTNLILIVADWSTESPSLMLLIKLVESPRHLFDYCVDSLKRRC